jgi:hypothetical protein
MILELHVYGQVVKTGSVQKTETQHIGLGTQMLSIAEKISYFYNYRRIAVISGEGVRGYYKKKGFVDSPSFMVKKLSQYNMLKTSIRVSDIQAENYYLKRSETKTIEPVQYIECYANSERILRQTIILFAIFILYMIIVALVI